MSTRIALRLAVSLLIVSVTIGFVVGKAAVPNAMGLAVALFADDGNQDDKEDAQKAQKDDGQKNQNDDGQKNQNDDGQKNQNDDGQENQNGEGAEKKGMKKISWRGPNDTDLDLSDLYLYLNGLENVQDAAQAEQKDGGQQNQNDDGQKNQKDDGQKNQKDDGQKD